MFGDWRDRKKQVPYLQVDAVVEPGQAAAAAVVEVERHADRRRTDLDVGFLEPLAKFRGNPVREAVVLMMQSTLQFK